MQIISQFAPLPLAQPEKGTAVAMGFFDGIHLGHAALLDRTRQRAQALGLTPAALSFDTHPDTLVFGTAVPLLNTMAERELLMRRLCGMEQVIFAHFDEAMMHMPWQVFVEDYLVRQLHAKHVVCGHDFHFGDRGQGDPARLQEKCRELGIGCDVIPEIRVDGSAVSSTRIRKAVEEGDIPTANRLLGRPFGFSLEVIHGNHIGTGLGTPTINQAIPEGFVLPRFGVYASWCRVGGQFFYGVTNVGVKPTVGSDKVLAETWMPEFSGDLYGKRVRVFLLEFLRPERKFASLEELKAAITYNGRQAQAVAARTPPPAFPASRG